MNYFKAFVLASLLIAGGAAWHRYKLETCRLWPAGATPPVVGWYVNAQGGKCAPLVTARAVYFCGSLIVPADPWYASDKLPIGFNADALIRAEGDTHHCTYDFNGLTVDNTKDYYWAARRAGRAD